MSAIPISKKNYTIEEYLGLQEKSIERLEYHNGMVRAMSGGTINHGVLCSNSVYLLKNGIKEKNSSCTTLGSEVKIYIEKDNAFIYPDAMLICDEIETAKHDKNAIVNPVLIIEVLSKSTERYDRGNKFHKYCSLPSFKEYILIDPNKPVVDLLYKADPTYWKMTTAIGLDKSFYIHTLDLMVSMSDLYEGTQKLNPPSFQLELD